MKEDKASLAAADGTLLALTRWRTGTAPARATVLIVHGLGEHVGRYAALAARLGDAGFDVSAYDQRGHGRSAGARGSVPAADTLLSDLGLVIDAERQRGARPLVLLGHSMGGMLAARFVAEALRGKPAPWHRDVDALVLSSPALAADLNPLQKLLLAIGSLLPDMAAHNGLKPEWISRDPAVVAAYVADPLVHDRITPRLAKFVLSGGALVCELAPRWTVPTLLLWAGADRCVAPRGSQEFAAAAPPAVLAAQCFDGLFHEIFNELPADRERVLAALTGWLHARY